MRACITFFLAILLSLNAASAAVVDICDALERAPSHTTHFGHHSHDHGGDNHNEDLSNGPDGSNGTSDLPVASDHHHAHSHPCFSSLLSNAIEMKLPRGSTPLVEPPNDSFSSALLARLDRPPRAALA